MSKNRMAVTQWSITFPQTTVDRKTFLESFPPAKAWVCAQEEHEDGGKHLHLGLVLTKGITKVRLLKWIAIKWPNDYKRIKVEGVKVWQNWVDYCMKEDPEALFKPLVRGDKKKYIVPKFILAMLDDLEIKIDPVTGKCIYDESELQWIRDCEALDAKLGRVKFTGTGDVCSVDSNAVCGPVPHYEVDFETPDGEAGEWVDDKWVAYASI